MSKVLSTPDFEEAALVRGRTTHPDAQWFPEAGLGLFLHWGIHSVAGLQPSWAMINQYPYGYTNDYPPDRYFGLAEEFRPNAYDPERWLAAAAAAGFRYAVLTTKHHDGYTLWPSEVGPFGVQSHLGGRDLVRDFVTACRNQGLRVGLYFSFADWKYPGFPMGDVDFDHRKRGQFSEMDPEEDERRFETFLDFTCAQLRELLTGYGPVDLLWFDGVGWRDRKPHQMRGEEVIPWLRSLMPGVVINNRWGRIGDYVTPEGRFPAEKPVGWWEACHCTNPLGHWGYTPNEPFPPTEWFVDLTRRCNAWGGNFLPNVGPAPDGTMPPYFYDLCRDLKMQREKLASPESD
jgi:alpha-L-fucosidase